MVSAAYDVGASVERDPVMAAFYAYVSHEGGNPLGTMFFRSVYGKLDEARKQELEAMIEANIRPAGRDD